MVAQGEAPHRELLIEKLQYTIRAHDRAIVLGRKSWLFAGSDRGVERAALMLTLTQTGKRNDVDPQAWPCRRAFMIRAHKITDLAWK